MLRVGILQTKVVAQKQQNLDNVRRNLDVLKAKEIDIVTLPEMFNCPYSTENFPIYAEEEGGKSFEFCSNLAKEYQIYLSAGSMPEVDEKGRVYNTAYMFDSNGVKIAKHRKLHLFDIDVKGGQRFFESQTLTKGDEFSTFDTKWGKMGICVCFDFRFPELARLMALDGAKLILVPAAFNMTTGPAHWEILFRTRAMENQIFVVATAPARDTSFSYHSWGHSFAINPWGQILYELDEKEANIICELDLNEVKKYRGEIPMIENRREDLYSLKTKF